MRVLIVSLALVLVHGVAAQGPAPGSIGGVVVDGVSGDPLAGVDVTLTRAAVAGEPAFRRALRTSGDGRFAFAGLPPGEYHVAGRRDSGYMPANVGQGLFQGTAVLLALGAGEALGGVELRMTPYGVITGRVVDRDGQPVANADVAVLERGYSNGWRILRAAARTRADDRGEYRAPLLPPGKYYVAATPAPDSSWRLPRGMGGGGSTFVGHGGGVTTYRSRSLVTPPPSPEPTAGGDAYVPVYYPDALDWSGASELTLDAGMELAGVDITASLVRQPAIGGVVVDRDTPAGESMTISTFIVGATRSPMPTQSGADGTFSIAIDPGSYVLSLRSGGASALVPIVVEREDVSDLRIEVRSGVPLRGRVTIDGGTQPGSIGPETIGLRLWPDMPPVSLPSFPSARPDAEGRFTLAEVVPAVDYRVTIDVVRNLFRQNAYVRSIRLGSTDVLVDGLRIDDAVDAVLDVVIGADGGRVQGRALLEGTRPAPNVRVVLVPDEPFRRTSERYQWMDTGPDGVFQFQGVAPGGYTMFAWRYVESGAWQNAEYLRAYEPMGTAVRVEAGGEAVVDLRVIPPPDYLSSLVP